MSIDQQTLNKSKADNNKGFQASTAVKERQQN